MEPDNNAPDDEPPKCVDHADDEDWNDDCAVCQAHKEYIHRELRLIMAHGDANATGVHSWQPLWFVSLRIKWLRWRNAHRALYYELAIGVTAAVIIISVGWAATHN